MNNINIIKHFSKMSAAYFTFFSGLSRKKMNFCHLRVCVLYVWACVIQYKRVLDYTKALVPLHPFNGRLRECNRHGFSVISSKDGLFLFV